MPQKLRILQKPQLPLFTNFFIFFTFTSAFGSTVVNIVIGNRRGKDKNFFITAQLSIHLEQQFTIVGGRMGEHLVTLCEAIYQPF